MVSFLVVGGGGCEWTLAPTDQRLFIAVIPPWSNGAPHALASGEAC